jgi:hypothetical protein
MQGVKIDVVLTVYEQLCEMLCLLDGARSIGFSCSVS